MRIHEKEGEKQPFYTRNMFVTDASPLQQLTKCQTHAIRDIIRLEREEQFETRHLNR
jgi:hypothetical protein